MKKLVSLSTGVRIEYVEQGKADGVPVIFLHGVTDSWRSFERVLPLLPLRGHVGGSPRVRGCDRSAHRDHCGSLDGG